MNRLRILLPALFASLFLPSSLAAEEQDSMNLLDVIAAGGLIGSLIIVLSIVAVAIIVEHFVSIKREKISPQDSFDEVDELFQEENYQEALEYCEAEDCALTRVVMKGLRRHGHTFSAIEKAIEEAVDEETVKLHQKIGWLSLIAGVAPMMGLFGTVTGMVGAFNIIATQKGGVEPSDFAASISMALVTTVLGLTVAIPVTGMFVFFRNRVVMASIELGEMAEELFERFRTV